MRLLLFLFSLGAVVSLGMCYGGKWGKYKLMESCFGSDVANTVLAKVKTAVAKCKGEATPRNGFRKTPSDVVKGLLGSILQSQGSFKIPDNFWDSMLGGEGGGNLDLGLSLSVPSKLVLKGLSMMKRGKKNHGWGGKFMGRPGGHPSISDFMPRPPRGNPMGSNDFGSGLEINDAAKLNQLINTVVAMARSKRSVQKRQADDSDVATVATVEEALVNRLEKLLMNMRTNRDNITCVMREMNMENAEGNLDLDVIMEGLNDYNIKDEWLLNQTNLVVRSCFASTMATSMDYHNMLKFCQRLSRDTIFVKCVGESLIQVCTNKDAIEQLESVLGPLSELAVQTGEEEMTLIKVGAEIISMEGRIYESLPSTYRFMDAIDGDEDLEPMIEVDALIDADYGPIDEVVAN